MTYDTSNEKLQEAMEIIRTVCEEHPNVMKDSNVFIETLSSSSIDIKLQTYVKTGTYASLTKVRSDVIFEIVKRFRSAGIDFAFPSQSIYIEKK